MLSYKEYEIIWLKIATKSLKPLDNNTKIRLLDKIDLLLLDSNALDIKKLEGFSDLYRIKYGDYRIIYKVSAPDRKIYIAAIGHRKQVYRILKILSKIVLA